MSTPVFLLKLVGSSSLGLLTGVSYSLSAITSPSLHSLPSSDDRDLVATSSLLARLLQSYSTHQIALTASSSLAFVGAYVLSPRRAQHPYLLYASALAISSAIVGNALSVSSLLTSVSKTDRASSSSSSDVWKTAQDEIERDAQRTRAREDKKKRQQEKLMESSYEVLGESQSSLDDAAFEEVSSSARDGETDQAKAWAKAVRETWRVQVAQTGLALAGFVLSLTGIWGDGY